MTRTISQLAKELNLNVETIRFYERKGLITQPPKPVSGYRHYSDDIVNRMRFIIRAKELGFTLEEIASLLSLNDSPCLQVQDLAQHKLTTVQAKMKDLRRLEQALKALLAQCQSNDDESHCPIIDSLLP
jgi:MerR family mercuric resistance operon transcriptional regulator